MSFPENPLNGLPAYPVNPEANFKRFIDGPHAPAVRPLYVRPSFELHDYQRRAFERIELFEPKGFFNGLKEISPVRFVLMNSKEGKDRFLKGYTRPLKFRTDFPAGMENTFHYDNSHAEWEVEFTEDIKEAKFFDIPPGTNISSVMMQHQLTMKNWGKGSDWSAIPADITTIDGKEEPPFYIMATFYKRFIRKSPHLRYGQQFHQWAKLEKLTSHKAKLYADKIYNAPDAEAKKLIEAIVDWNN